MAAGESPDLIRQDVERTREELGATAEALAYKADAPARMKDRVTDARDRITGAVSDRTPDGREIRRSAGRVRHTAEHNPLGLVLGSVALGFVAGTLVPATDAERRVVGPAARELQGAVSDAASEIKDAATPAGSPAAG